MAAGRKLATEIDRCLKQVAERVEIFEETWDKVRACVFLVHWCSERQSGFQQMAKS
jgi:hypothetical protein